MSSTTLVTGGTGLLGAQVVPLLRQAGHKVRVLSRRSRTSQDGLVFLTGDLATGEVVSNAAVLLFGGMAVLLYRGRHAPRSIEAPAPTASVTSAVDIARSCAAAS